MDRLIHKCIHFPVSRTAADIFHKVVDHLCSLCRVQHFRMELDRIQTFLRIFRRRNRAVCSMRAYFKSRSHLCDIIKMTHPADRGFGYILKYFGLRLVNQHFRLPILADRRSFYLSAQHMRHQLSAIAQPQHRNPQFKQFPCIRRRIRLVTAVRSPCQNDSFRIHFFDLFNIDFV